MTVTTREIKFDDRVIGIAEIGSPDGTPVIDCHGGPGSRLSLARLDGAAEAAGLRIVGIDRPGYGLSTPRPGRSITDWLADYRAVADALALDQVVVTGTSTGGSYALTVADAEPDHVRGVVLCSSIVDTRWQSTKTLLVDRPGQLSDMWASTSRDEAIRIARDFWGEDGLESGRRGPDPRDRPLAEADVALASDMDYLMALLADMAAAFAQGPIGYADDRIADRDGWPHLDLTAISCPVAVLHGECDSIIPAELARELAAAIPGSQLRIIEGAGHLSAIDHLLDTVTAQLEGVETTD